MSRIAADVPAGRGAVSLQYPAPSLPVRIVTAAGAEILASRLLEACGRAGRAAEVVGARSTEGAAIVVDLSGEYRACRAQEVWRLRAGVGKLHGRFALSASWHRAPHWLPVLLTRTIAGEPGRPAARSARADAETIGAAYIGCTGSLRELQAKAASTAAILLRRALSGQPSPDPEASAGAIPTRRDGAVAAVGGWFRRQSARWYARLFTEWWTIGICEQPIEAILGAGGLGAVAWLRAGRGSHYWADPFPWPGTTEILVEECAVAGGPGTIAVLRPAMSGGWERDRDLLGDALHRSYPFTFLDDDRVYLLPECLGAGTTELFRLDGSGHVDPVAKIAGGALADATLFRHGGRYWVAATDVAIGAHDNLCLFHADRLAGPWRPHLGNPVKIDIRSSRSAGTPFVAGGRLFRPAQDCSSGYGAAVVVNEILTLTPDSFAERPVLRLAPDVGGPLPHGMHTLAAAGGRTLVDAKRMVFAPGLAAARLLRRLRLDRPELHRARLKGLGRA